MRGLVDQRFSALGYMDDGDPNCVVGMPYDVDGNPCPGAVEKVSSCAAGMPYDDRGRPCPGTPAVPASGPGPTYSPGNRVVVTPGQPKAPGPANRVSVPLSLQIPGSVGMFFTNSTIISGIPNFAVIGGGVILISMMGGMFGGKRRRR